MRKEPKHWHSHLCVTWNTSQHAGVTGFVCVCVSVCVRVGVNDLSQPQLQISIIRALQVQECSTAALSSLFISLPLSLFPYLSLTLILSLLLSLNPSLFVALLLSFPHSFTEPLCNVDHQAPALPANTQLTLGSVSYFFQGCTVSHIMSVYLFPHNFGGGGWGFIQTVCLPVQTRADAQGNVYNVSINSCSEKCKMTQKCQKPLISLEQMFH